MVTQKRNHKNPFKDNSLLGKKLQMTMTKQQHHKKRASASKVHAKTKAMLPSKPTPKPPGGKREGSIPEDGAAPFELVMPLTLTQLTLTQLPNAPLTSFKSR